MSSLLTLPPLSRFPLRGHGLLAIFVVGIADSKEMLALLGEQEQGRDEQRGDVTPIHFLAILNEIDLVVRHTPARIMGRKDEKFVIHGLNPASTAGWNFGNCPADVLGLTAVVAASSQKQAGQQARQRESEECHTKVSRFIPQKLSPMHGRLGWAT